jgi:parallel beta-helix repeat protein
MDNSDFGFIHDNIIMRNSEGIWLEDSNYNNITENLFLSNQFAFYIDGAQYNNIFHNNFINNGNEVNSNDHRSDRNQWDNGWEGNYWSNYWDWDLGGDGIGDNPYDIYDDAEDYYPLLDPWTGSLPPDTTPPYFTMNPDISRHTLEIPGSVLFITFEINEFCIYEIIIDTDGIPGFDASSDLVLSENVSRGEIWETWEGMDREGNYVDDGEHQIQIMLWDRAGNSLAEPYNIGTVTTIRDLDQDGVIDIHDAFPEDRGEWKDSDNDGIGDNSDPDWDNDGVDNDDDEFPHDPDEWSDMDGDGIGDNADPDDNDNDIPDIAEMPIVFLILLIPLLVFYLTNKHVRAKKEAMKKEEGEKEEEEEKK